MRPDAAAEGPAPAAAPVAAAPAPAEAVRIDARPPTGTEPLLLVGLQRRVPRLRVVATGEMDVLGPDGRVLARVREGDDLLLQPGAGVVVLGGGRVGSAREVELRVAPGGRLRVDGTGYLGPLLVRRDAQGLTLIERLPLEAYLRGVVPAELGRRPAAELEAVKAQAVIARTYALRNRGRWRGEGFDLLGTTGDQVYGGADAHDPVADDALRLTRGEVLAAGGQPVDAFFHSTCGGRTEDGPAIFRGSDGQYLRAVDDVDDEGRAYCRDSPRFRWRERWDEAALAASLARGLPPSRRLPTAELRALRDLRITGRTASGRVAAVELETAERRVPLDGPTLRLALRLPGGEPMRSTAVAFTVTRGAGGRLAALEAEGRGAGHGVGLCQWGAIGRARAGHGYRRILGAYFPGTTLERRWR
ncbi:MAG: SpoIID/LytB domain-containing protein [Gemmatimonadales bacterium]|nr:SpoIID/LytB domain-containing protein [Gemmatimonadales bacterium]